MNDEILIVSSEEFMTNPEKYTANIDKIPIRIVNSDSGLTISVMGLAEPRRR